MYARFLPLQVEEVTRHATLVAGALTLVRFLEARGIAIASTTGYPKEVMARLLPLAASQGYSPECAIDATDVALGRPKPWMIFRAMEVADAHPPQRVVVVDDTPVGVQAGAAAGAFTVGVVDSANAMGLTFEALEAFKASDPHGYEDRYRRIEREHLEAGANLVVPTVASLLVP
jgi:phosphonoacetaldehyde hydrolase